ncbi:hypothetical protein BAUCODRAFT_36156 [Baudoinia panamericana UAMH 10762]|uniref:DUF1772-domain-containing protein n=1 Tax=Baudoinia panamericana (strain UAMH 10762) TaxID=717646 RepID=M2MTM0_BAUPA|nr:uncharacterized protein BAUCODRAFT_36156 [Baudoinia panamericana UAMH 10762]EMC94883.1 hypothetical protein BAUCODRAFT_36156 [Baudoinia panamericana UAMH 10762]
MDSTRISQLLAIPGAFFLGSYNATFSQNVMPHLYSLSPSEVTPIFEKIYHRGAATILPIASIAIAANGYLSYESDTTKRRLYGTAAVLMVATLPLTQIVMGPGINRLIEISKDASLRSKTGTEAEVVKLLKSWVTFNSLRASLHLTAGMLSLYAALS